MLLPGPNDQQHNKLWKEEGRILIINYSFLVFELNRSLRSPKDD
jgi:hypothetical protein